MPVASVGIGDEEILRTRLEVIDGGIAGPEGPDMLLGADFIMAHHIYVARGQRRIYFTYSGGRAFITGQPAEEGKQAPPPDLPAGKIRVEAVNGVPDPKTAEEFARRGNARLTAGKADAALADFTEAVRLAPGKASYYGDRSRAHEANGDARLAAADIDKALALDPGNGELLIVRAVERLHGKDKVGALADTEAAERVVPRTSLQSLGVADLFQHLGQPARAIPLFDAVIDAHPADSKLPAMLNGRCWQRALANVDLDKALDDCNRAIKRGGLNPGFLDSRALVYYRQGDFKAALADYDAALALNPRIAWSLHMRGLIRIASGQAEAGRADQAAAAAIQPDIAEEVAGLGIGRTVP